MSEYIRGKAYEFIINKCRLIKAYIINNIDESFFVELWYHEEEKVFYIVIKDSDGLRIHSTKNQSHADLLFSTRARDLDKYKQL